MEDQCVGFTHNGSKRCPYIGKFKGSDGKAYCGHHVKHENTNKVNTINKKKLNCFRFNLRSTYMRISYIIATLIVLHYVHHQARWYHYQYCESTLFRALTAKKSQLCITADHTLDFIETFALDGLNTLYEFTPSQKSIHHIIKIIKS